MGLVTVVVDVAPRPYEVVVGDGACARMASDLSAFTDVDAWAVVADERALELHPGAAPRDLGPLLALDGGEGAKEIEVLGRTLDHCASAGLSRNSCLVAFGGGTIGDLTGLCATLYKRGIDVVQVPTTLLAQVDASVGGKTAINLAAGKNLAGTFHQPRKVYCDTGLLGSLTDDDWASGLGEVVKTAIIAGDDVLDRLEERADALMARDATALADVVADCVRTKAEVVMSDPLENGRRKVLNLGHTFGHGIEHAAGYGRVPHGVAVATGLAIAQRASEHAFGTGAEQTARVLELLRRFDLPATLAELGERYGIGAALDEDALRVGIGHDKKGSFGRAKFVLARKPGDVEWDVELDDALLSQLLTR